MNFKQTKKLLHAARKEIDTAALKQALKDNHERKVGQQGSPHSLNWKYFFRVTAWMIGTLTALATITGLISFAADFSKCVSVEAVTELEPRLPANSPLLEKVSGDIPSVTFSVKNLKNYT